MSSASRLQLDKLPREEQIDVLRKVYHKRSGLGEIEDEDKTEILNVEEIKENNSDDEDNDTPSSTGIESKSSGGGKTKKVSFEM